jgi:hypothetical protein
MKVLTPHPVLRISDPSTMTRLAVVAGSGNQPISRSRQGVAAAA